MLKNEVALQLALAALEKGNYYTKESTNEGVGEAIATVYNTIYKRLEIKDSGTRV